MTNPIAIPLDHSSSQDTPFGDNLNRPESISCGSDCTELSIGSQNIIIAERWIVSGKIGEGSFGEVFKVRDMKTNRRYAVKRENSSTKHSQMVYESKMYDVLSGGVGIPSCHWQGNMDGFECIIMDLLGPNLGQVRQNVSSMELDIAIDLVCQMVSIVEGIHSRGVIFRDIKPDNFLFSSQHYLPDTQMIETADEYGMPMTSYQQLTCRQLFDQQWGDSHPKLYAVDFGLACYWRDPDTGDTYPDVKKPSRNKTGTARYASINVHRGRSHSRRDDMESIGYILLDMLMGTLPWTGIHARNSKAGWDRMRQLKTDTFMSDLCAGLPTGVLKFVEYPRKLQFGDQPDYEKMRQYLKGSLAGGAYADLVKSPFGGQTKSTDSYDTIQHELKQRQQKELEQQQQILDQYNKSRQKDMEHDDGLDNTTRQLADTNLSQPNNKKQQQQQRKASTTSQSSIEKLLKANLKKAVGWNTYKHDQAPWNPKTTWTNDDDGQTGGNVAKCWDDNHKELGTWGEPPTTTPLQGNRVDSWGSVNDGLKVEWNEQSPAAHYGKKTSKNEETTGMTSATWGEQPSWNSTPAHNDTKKQSNQEMTTTTWGEQPSWNSTPAHNDTKKLSNQEMTTTTWGDQPSWDAAPIQHDSRQQKTQENMTATTETWGKQPPWDTTLDTSTTWGKQVPWDTVPPTTQHDMKTSKNRDPLTSNWNQHVPKNRTMESKRDRKTSSRKTTQHSMNGPRKHIPADSNWSTTAPRTTQHDKKFSNNHMKWGKENHQLTAWDTTQDSHHKYVWPTDKDMEHAEQQWKEASWTKTTEQVDGWQRKPGSNSWQQKRRPLAK